MNYWKGLAIAAAIDAVWLMGCPATSTGPDPLPPQELAVELPNEPLIEESVLTQSTTLGLLEDSLMLFIQAHPEDVGAMEKLADAYASEGFFDAAIAPLARALQLDGERRSLWVALDRAVEQSGMVKITDAELVQRAREFVETIESWGHGC